MSADTFRAKNPKLKSLVTTGQLSKNGKKINNVSAKTVPPEQRYSRPVMTNFEYTRLVGIRMNELFQGAAPMVPVPEQTEDINYPDQLRIIARLELEAGLLPYIVERPVYHGSKGLMLEHFPVQELEITKRTRSGVGAI